MGGRPVDVEAIEWDVEHNIDSFFFERRLLGQRSVHWPEGKPSGSQTIAAIEGHVLQSMTQRGAYNVWRRSET